jgi:hypothetical protein
LTLTVENWRPQVIDTTTEIRKIKKAILGLVLCAILTGFGVGLIVGSKAGPVFTVYYPTIAPNE